MRWLVVLGALAATTTATVPIAQEPVAAASRRPNIVLITTDDMALTDLRWMPRTRKLIRAAGVSMRQFISNHPLCCPARAEILTGQHAHNNGVRHNDGAWGGYSAMDDDSEHIGAWLSRAGYRTAFVGKHLNLWEVTQRTQPGWTRFNPAFRGIYDPFDVTMWRDGSPQRYTGTHTSDLVGRFTRRYIRSFAGSGAPFFIWTSQVAPHGMLVDGEWGPPRPAERHRGLYSRVAAPALSDRAYDEADVSDKPAYVHNSVTMPPRTVTTWHRARIRSLRSVDDQVKAVVDTLREVGQLRNTYIFFTSDNGYLFGQHRVSHKNLPYEEALRIPLVVRGPGIPAGPVRQQLFSLVDLAPTFLQIAQAQPGAVLDGRSMLPSLEHGLGGYDDYLIQGGAANRPWWWRGVRSRDSVFVRYDNGFEELYDLRTDPDQLTNVARDPAYAHVVEQQRARLVALTDCVGATCWSPAGQ